MRTVEQWLALGDKLPTELARVLTPGPWKHDLLPEHPSAGMLSMCSKCREVSPICGPCPIPDPITIDWNTAMEWMRECDRDEFLFAMWKVSNLYPDRDGQREKMLGWCVFLAQPKHYLIAAAKVAERKEQ